MYNLVEFQSGTRPLRGRLYKSSDSAPFVIMTHGTSATITMVVDRYAEAIHCAGFNVLLYDHPNFGMSSGEPRYEINPWLQGRGYADAAAWLRKEHAADALAIWGDSYSGMIVLVVAGLIPDIAAVIAQIPTCGADIPEIVPGEESLQTLKQIFTDGDIRGDQDRTTGPLPVVSADQLNAPSLLTPIQAFRWFTEYGGRHGSMWENRVTRNIPATRVPFTPFITAPYITAPVLMMTGRDDEMIHCNPGVQRAVFDRITAPKEHYEIAGGHFGLLWHPGALFNEAVAEQTAFLQRIFS